MKQWFNLRDRRGWANGEWDMEPDKMHWISEETGFDCLIVRNCIGALCGYVGVPEGHPCFEMDYGLTELEIDSIDIHGGLNFADFCQPEDEDGEELARVCHPIEGAANELVWWLGFDCSHALDEIPAVPIPITGSAYRNFEFVQAEVERLAQQLKTIT
jgi:hypothetical protein